MTPSTSRPSLLALLLLLWRLWLARLFLWLARKVDRYNGVIVRLSDRAAGVGGGEDVAGTMSMQKSS